MAGLFAARALRAGRETFDPFGEVSSDDEDDLADVEEPDEMTPEEERKLMAKATGMKPKWEVNAARWVSQVRS